MSIEESEDPFFEQLNGEFVKILRKLDLCPHCDDGRLKSLEPCCDATLVERIMEM